jgi:hypothetical protein
MLLMAVSGRDCDASGKKSTEARTGKSGAVNILEE